ncbi:hypothetical protein A7X66_09245 [Stenotrophomonas maltophilia]|nr:hypothetical protein A7X66_09245 [Stenotrophomonas maltophilia]
MNTIFWVMWGCACVGIAAWHVWAGRANNATHRERNQIIQAMVDAGWPSHLHRQYSLVDYQAHLREKFWGRDALSLYPRELQEVVRAYRGECA